MSLMHWIASSFAETLGDHSEQPPMQLDHVGRALLQARKLA